MKDASIMTITALRLTALTATSALLLACSAASNEVEASAKAQDGSSETNTKLAEARARDGALGDMIAGDENAEVTLVEYASFTCGHCSNFHATVFPDIKKKYIESGKIKFIFRELPTPPQDLSYIGSVMARCAADRGGDKAFFAIGDSLFSRQREWAFGDNPKLELLKIASQAGMDEPALNECLQRQEIVDVINENVKDARSNYQVTGTPSFVLNGEKLNLRTLADLDTALAEATGLEAESEETETQAPTE